MIPNVSIIIVTYNADKFLDTCIKSILKNINSSCEIIIFDGMSTDRTIEIIKKYEKSIAYWESKKDKGIYDAMNKAVLKARGRWILFFGADDCLLSDFPKMLAQLKNSNTIYYGHAIMKNKIFGRKTNCYRLAKANLCHQAILYPRKIFDSYKYDLRYIVYADYLLNIQLWGNKRYKKKYLPIAIAQYSGTGYSSLIKDPEFMSHKAFYVKTYLGFFTYIRYKWKKWRQNLRKENNFF